MNITVSSIELLLLINNTLFMQDRRRHLLPTFSLPIPETSLRAKLEIPHIGTDFGLHRVLAEHFGHIVLEFVGKIGWSFHRLVVLDC